MPVATRRWNDPVEPGDGFRVLVCRYRPRGVTKQAETGLWEAWMPDLGPSRELHAAYWGKASAGGARLPWPEYRRRYLEEMMHPSGRGVAMLAALAARVAAGETVTLLCSSACTDSERCHRTLLAALVEKAAVRLAARPRSGARPSRP